MYRRLPEHAERSASEGVYASHAHTAGGRVKFITDSDFVAIRAVMNAGSISAQRAYAGTTGFDLYVGKEEFYGTFFPPCNISNGYESMMGFKSSANRLCEAWIGGNAKAEDEIAQYIKDLDMCAFVYDYDCNAPGLKHLEDTRQRMFLTIRESDPELPIVILSRPKHKLNEVEKQRLSSFQLCRLLPEGAAQAHRHAPQGNPAILHLLSTAPRQHLLINYDTTSIHRNPVRIFQ